MFYRERIFPKLPGEYSNVWTQVYKAIDGIFVDTGQKVRLESGDEGLARKTYEITQDEKYDFEYVLR